MAARTDNPIHHRWRLALSGLSAGAVIAAAIAIPTIGHDRTGSLTDRFDAASAARAAARPHTHAGTRQPDGHTHDHSDPTTKNDVSRAGETGADTQDPTTPAQARAATAYVQTQRNLPDPTLTAVPLGRSRTTVPQDRYAAAGGCYALTAPDGRAIGRGADGRLRAGGRAAPLFFKATTLGTFLLHGTARDFVSAGDLLQPGPRFAATPSTDTEWTLFKRDGRFTVRAPGNRFLTMRAGQPAIGGTPARFGLTRTPGCTAYPESQVNITGDPHAGITPYQEVRGYVDAHTHGMAFEFLGGEAHCGRPWHKYGAPYALQDCADHRATGGTSPLEAVLSGEPHHDPVGWPTFKDWPAPESLTHEGTYYKWMERSWRGGQRLFVNLLVENNQLCQLYPLKRNSCDDMDSLRLQAKDMYQLQDYIDAQWGGPGRGWYRIVTDPWQARRVINAGKLAVVMGIETSVPFGCSKKLDIPQCSKESIDRQLDEMHRLGVRQMELVNKFDNALSGVAGDNGAVGVAVNGANFLETGSFWSMARCEPADGESHDRDQLAAPEISAEQQDALFGAVAKLYAATGVALPVYGPPHHCNQRGLTPLGSHLINRLASKHMLFDPDHMSVKGRDAALDELERLRYPGVLSSHSWSTPDAYPRIYGLGGFVAPYAGDSTGFVAKWRRHLGWANPHYYFGFGFGADINGLGAQGDPRGAGVPNPVRYPFRGLHGVRIDKQHAGRRVYDLNVEGVAQYGLYPDWIEDLRKVSGGDAIVDDMTRGPEAYLQTWERAEGIKPDPCRNPGLRRTVAGFEQAVRPGMGVRAVMRAVGQPWQRLGRTFTSCARTPSRARVVMKVDLTQAGRVAAVRRLR